VWYGCQAPTRQLGFERAAGPYSAFEGEQGEQHTLCPFGVPEIDETWGWGPTERIDRPGYLLEHGSDYKIPFWVCELVKESDLTGPGNRKKCSFKAEPRLARGERAVLSDYRGSGYDRGHQAPAADFKSSQDDTCDSFLLSNMAPQVGIGFNRDIWRFLETRTRDVVENRGKAFVITGGMLYDPKEEDKETADGFIDYDTIGNNQVAVPTHFYKIIVAKNDGGEWEAIGFVLENKAYPRVSKGKYDFAPFIRSIDWIEDRTGINFMPILDEEKPELEEALERDPAADLWPGFRSD
jgi:endonuclease G